MRKASSMIAAISRQSTLFVPVVSRNTPSHPENVPAADVGGSKNRSGSPLTSSSDTPDGAGHHNETRPSPL